MREQSTNASVAVAWFTFDNRNELPFSAARALNVRSSGILGERVAVIQSIPEEGIMPKQPLKFAVVKVGAFACVASLTLNTFAISSGSAARMASTVSRTPAGANALEQKPMPSPTPGKPAISPAKDNMAAQA